MPSITGLSATTELEAINAMLSAIGEAPIDDVDTATQADVAMAINLLRNAVREVQAMGWKFNTEHGYELAPAAELSWLDTAGVTTLLNIFTPPAKLLSFVLTPSCTQLELDVTLRPPRQYASASVFYDRKLNRDGFDKTRYPFLYIDPVWAFDFEQMPESARRFCALHAARQLIEHTVGSPILSGFSEKDEQLAYRNLKLDQGDEDEYSMTPSVQSAFGDRPVLVDRVIDLRSSPGPD